jgi:DNA-binding XRE family transcriptional regulator
MQNNKSGSIVDDPNVARPINDKLKRQTRTLGQALGFVVTQLRVKKKWSQGDLARRSGFEITTINRLERGKANPTMALVIVMADTFGLRPSQLLSRAEQKSRKHAQTSSL